MLTRISEVTMKIFKNIVFIWMLVAFLAQLGLICAQVILDFGTIPIAVVIVISANTAISDIVYIIIENK